MANLLMILMTGPYSYQNTQTVIDLAEAALKKEHKVRIHLFIDGPINANRFQISTDERIPLYYQELEKIRQKGAKISYCPTCAELRGVKDHMIEHTEGKGLAALGEAIMEADKVLTFGIA